MDYEQALALCQMAEKMGNAKPIFTKDGKGVYMMRYMFMKTDDLSINFHRFLQSDPEIPHDHPWDFYTHIISGGYDEEQFEHVDGKLVSKGLYRRNPGTTEFRAAETVHRVVLDRVYTLDELEQAPLTMCIHLKRKRQWGFLQPTDMGFVWNDWRPFLGIYPGDPRYEGSE